MARRDRPERPEKPEKLPPPPPPAYPPSTPEISFHLYGLNWDLTGGSSALAPAQRTFHITVTAVDGIHNPLGPQLQATAAIDVVGMVRHLPGFRD